MTDSACILGCAGPMLTPAETAFFADAQPWGFILFGRNIETPEQVRALTAALREVVGRDAPILVDQEGGRVQRLKPPYWPAYPPARTYDALRDPEIARLGARLMAHDLAAVGIDVDCLPVLDVPAPDGHEVIGDRAYADTPDRVAVLGRAAAEGLMAGGVLPVIKHAPGHGRARADSHHDLPVVEASAEDLAARDFVPFQALSDMPMAMSAHVIYAAFDRQAPASVSRTVIEDVVRGAIGFDGLLMTDDLSMKALTGSFRDRAEAARAAGCDVVLHCNGDMAEMAAVVSGCGALDRAAARRADAALSRRQPPVAFDVAEARARFAASLGRLAA